MGKSGNPAVAASETKRTIASASDFKKRKEAVYLDLPSGVTVRAKRAELQTFVLQGDVPNPLMEIVSQALEKGQKSDIPAMMGVEDGKVNLDMVRDMYELVNKLVIESLVEPKVYPAPDSEEARDDELLYVDEIDDEDKMFLFQWATGGTDDLTRFREEARASMDALAEVEDTASATE